MEVSRIDIDIIQDSDDDELYAYLCRTHPEGLEVMSDEEQETLMALLRKKCHSV